MHASFFPSTGIAYDSHLTDLNAFILKGTLLKVCAWQSKLALQCYLPTGMLLLLMPSGIFRLKNSDAFCCDFQKKE